LDKYVDSVGQHFAFARSQWRAGNNELPGTATGDTADHFRLILQSKNHSLRAIGPGWAGSLAQFGLRLSTHGKSVCCSRSVLRVKPGLRPALVSV